MPITNNKPYARNPRPRRDSRDRAPRVPEEFKEKLLDLRRVTRVVAGGKRLRFRATIIVGDERGRVGLGIGKGSDVQMAVTKARTRAKKNVTKISLKGRTIPHEVEAKFSAARVRLKPAVEGHGLKAGGAVRVVLALSGVKDIVGKCLGRTPNKLTNALATLKALKQLKTESPNRSKTTNVSESTN